MAGISPDEVSGFLPGEAAGIWTGDGSRFAAAPSAEDVVGGADDTPRGLSDGDSPNGATMMPDVVCQYGQIEG